MDLESIGKIELKRENPVCALIFVKFLNDIGVKKIMVGGTSLEIIEGQLSRCVGNFIEMMREYSEAEIKLSLGTAPLNKSEIKESNSNLVKDL